MIVGIINKAKVSDCPICFEDMSELTKVVITRCKHAFHETCMTNNFSLNDIKKTSCPYCRQMPIPMIRAQERTNEPETNPYIECKMLRALREGDVDYVKTALLEKPELIEHLYESKKNNQKYPLLTLAAAFGHQDLVVFLLDRLKKESVDDKPSSTDLTALSAACLYGHTNIVKLIINAGANVNKINQKGKDALWYAADSGKKEILKLLVEAGASVTNKTANNFTALFMAVQRGYSEMVNYLISVIPKEQLEEHVNICGSLTTTPTSALYMAAQGGYADIVSALILAGADPNRAIGDDLMPLQVAALNGHLEVVKLLIKNGAYVNYQSPDGTTALLCAAEDGHRNVCEFLLTANANPDLTVAEGVYGMPVNAAMVARGNGHIGLAEFLENFHPDTH